MVTTLAVPQTKEELNTFSNTLKALRETLSSLVTMPIDDFRSDDAHPTALCVAVMELAEIMKSIVPMSVTGEIGFLKQIF
jgi:hypothetical protein